MKIRKLLLCAILLSLAMFYASAGEWYVCIGSFKIAANAQRFSDALRGRGLPLAVTLNEDGETPLYRVVYDRPFESRNDARSFRNELLEDERILSLGIKGLWICEAESAMRPGQAEPQDEVLQKNDETSLPISDEKPFSLKVRSYKEEHPAVQNSERLRENDIDAYVVKTYDDDEYFSFDVHAGAFATPDESADTEAALAALGIDGATLSDYGEIKEKMRRYDEVVQQDDVVFETAENATMPEFSAAVRTCLADLPVNKNFLIESITIVDFETLAEAAGGYEQFKSLATEDGIRALAMAIYRDDLFGKRVEVRVVECSAPLPEMSESFGEAVQFALPGDDVLRAHITADRNIRTVKGMNTERTLLVKIDAYDFSDDEFDAFMNNAWADSATVIYPQLRKSLCVLPKNADGRHFAAFTLSHLAQSYAVIKHYANWAIPRVGHWIAEGYFLQGNEKIKVSFFDMDYAYNAQKVHEMFMNEKRNRIISDSNHPATVNGVDAWYLKSLSGSLKSIDFSIKSFAVGIYVDINSSLNEDDLHAFASDLLIWEQ